MAISLLEDPKLQSEKLFQSGVNFLYGKKSSIKKAIQCLQRAITIIDNDYRYWQFLGEAYYQRGSLNPAINSFNKSIQLSQVSHSDNDSSANHQESQRDGDHDSVNIKDYIYSKLRISDIRLAVGHLDEALHGYSQVLDKDLQNVAAMIGLAKTQLQMGKNHFYSGQINLGHAKLMEAIKMCLKSIQHRPDLCITWKLASDCCLIQYINGQLYQFEYTLGDEFSAFGGATLNRSHCLELSQRFLCRALTIEGYREYPCLWHNLGVSLLLKSMDKNSTCTHNEYLKLSLKCLLKALNYEPQSSSIRNTIGVVAYHLGQFNTSQHFFIKAIQTNRSTSELQFSNLGFSYLSRGEFSMASAAFTRCQAEEPLYVRSWIGKALVCDQLGLPNLSLLHHANILGNLYEAQILYGTKMIEQITSDQTLKDLCLAIDSVERATIKNPLSGIALNTLGLLYERLGFKQKSLRLLSEARKLEPDSRVLMNYVRQVVTKDTNSCPMNASCQLDDHESRSEAIKKAEQFASGSNSRYLLNIIYFLLNNQDYQFIEEKVAMLMKFLPENDLKSKICAQLILGIAARNLNGDFKSYLFKNILDSKDRLLHELIPNLLYLMVFGMRLGQFELVSQTSPDLVQLCQYRTLSNRKRFDDFFKSYEGFWVRATIFCTIYIKENVSNLKVR